MIQATGRNARALGEELSRRISWSGAMFLPCRRSGNKIPGANLSNRNRFFVVLSGGDAMVDFVISCFALGGLGTKGEGS